MNNMLFIYRYNVELEKGKLWDSIVELINCFIYELRRVVIVFEK